LEPSAGQQINEADTLRDGKGGEHVTMRQRAVDLEAGFADRDKWIAAQSGVSMRSAESLERLTRVRFLTLPANYN
jgi:hypothetical protein